MYHLPRTISSEVRSALEKELQDIALEKAMDGISRAVMRLFEAEDTLVFLYRFTDSGCEPFSCHVASQGGGERENCLRILAENWISAGIDTKIINDFRVRMNCVSYSAFAWPYGSVADTPSVQGISVPRDFTLLLPMNSQLSVSHETDPGFLGYFALFFDSFPQLSDKVIQLITSLPQILSDLVLSYLRRETKNDFEELNTFAHEVKRTLLFATDILETEAQHGSPCIANVQKSLKRLLQQSSCILLADRFEQKNATVSRVPLSLNELVREVASHFEYQTKKSNAQVIVELADDLPLSPIDPAIFPAVIENLLENALRYSGPNACIYLRTRRADNSQVCLEVRDSGQVIPKDEWPKIFEKHYRGAFGEALAGNGLGLYLVQKIVEAHEGRVFPKETEDERNCFVVELPSVEKI